MGCPRQTPSSLDGEWGDTEDFCESSEEIAVESSIIALGGRRMGGGGGEVKALSPPSQDSRGKRLPELPGPKDTAGENLDLAAGSWLPAGTWPRPVLRSLGAVGPGAGMVMDTRGDTQSESEGPWRRPQLIPLGKCRPFRAARLWCGLWAKVSLRTGWSGYRTLSSLVNSGRQCPIDIPTTLESLVWSELDWGDW